MMDFVPSGLVVMRTPLLPMEELESWNGDRAQLRARLVALLDRPEIAEAIFLASPDLYESLDHWRRDPESKKGRRTEAGLVRYFLRMASRPTPFGLFSGCTAGRVGERTRLTLDALDSYRRSSRLDMDYLFALCEHLARDPQVRAELRYRPNASLYESNGRLRFAESRVHGQKRTYHLVAVDVFDALRDTLERAADGARLADLAAALVDDEITIEEAQGFVHELVDNQLLVPELAPPVTGDETLLHQLDALQSAPDARALLARAETVLRERDSARIGSSPQHYLDLARDLESLGVPVELSRLFQVDLMKPAAEVAIGEDVIDEVRRTVGLLHRFSKGRQESSLDEFRRAFQDRYGADREMPLLDVLDEESGIGFERSANAGAEGSPLLAGLSMQRRSGGAKLSFGNADATMLDLLTRALVSGSIEVALTGEDVKRLENTERPQIPDAIQTMFTLIGDRAAIERGEFRMLFHGALGPSGARMLGRFCHIDDAIRQGVEEHVRAEEALRPDAVFAEIVHLPAGRIGNILARPVLRDHEISFLGRGGATRQIALDDLMVTVSGEQIRLRSKSLDREVIPRLSSAHNTTGESLGVYRFLAALQRAIAMAWNWGPLESASFLPRVVSGRTVLSRARWRIDAEIRPIAAAADRYRLAREFRDKHRMPRYVVLTDGDNELLVDFENELALDAVLDLVRNRAELLITELYPSPDELCAEGPEGRFFHELVVPFTRRAPAGVAARVDRKSPALLIARTFPPGSEWLYAKFYTGTATADRVLLEEIAPIVSGRWFFIRYGDPEWHLRVRFRHAPPHLREQLEAAGRRLVWKVQFDTYEREVERYGGPEAIELAEQIFHHDSEAVVALLESCSGDAGADLRWRLMIAGIDCLLADFDLDTEARLRITETCRDSFGRQFHYEAMRDKLASRFRPERASLMSMLDTPISALEQRSAAIVPIARELRRRRLSIPIETILPSLLHMHVNRMARSAGPEHEMVLYDYLAQLYRSRIARGKGRSRGPRIDQLRTESLEVAQVARGD